MGVGSVGSVLLLWSAVDMAAPWLCLLAALCSLLVAYGVSNLRRLGSAPDKRDGFEPRG